MLRIYWGPLRLARYAPVMEVVIMMDATFTAVSRLWEQGCSQKEICLRLNLSNSKVRKILVTIGAIETNESNLYAAGKTVEEIAEITGKTMHAVNSRIPYSKGIYNAEYPTINAMRIRKSRNGGSNDA